jgi:hypothetical protein
MPYFVHLKGVEPTFGTPYTDRAEAYRAQSASAGETVTLKLSEDEDYDWHMRERSRFMDGVYAKTPWHSEALNRARSVSDERFEQVKAYYCHLSQKAPDMVAYTPDADHGYQDRQVQIKPGKFLEKLTDLFSTAEIAAYVAQVKARGEGFKLATSAEDIVAVYTNGPGSCMGGKSADNFRTCVHPTSVYGDSDLALAYIGTKDRASARCIVWPEHKLYSRCYGDDMLAEQLRAAGWSHSYYLEGAKVRALKDTNRGGYIMPYLDCAESIDLETIKGVRWFVLREDEDGEYNCKDTSGYTCENERNHCQNCESRISEDETYCESCQMDLTYCARCGNETFDSSDFVEVDEEWYCYSCAQRWFHECQVDGCHGEWHSKEAGDLCHRHEDTHQECADCSTYVAIRGAAEDTYGNPVCSDCAEAYAEDTDEDTDTPRDEQVTPFTPLADETAPDYSIGAYTPIVRIPFGDGSVHYAEALATLGYLAVHKRIKVSSRDTDAYVVTHIPTGLAAIGCRTYQGALDAMVMLYVHSNVSPALWAFDNRHQIPAEVAHVGSAVRATYRERGELCL